jgi:PAS domain S-box-containing protein
VATVVVVGTAIVHANTAALTLVGAGDASEVVGQDPIRFVAPRSHGSALAQRLGEPDDQWSRPEVMSIQRVDGNEVLVEVASTPVLWDEVPATQITLWDLAGDTAKVRELATGIRTDVSEAIIVTDAQMRIQSFNTAAEDLYGWRERDVLGRPMADIVPCTTAAESSAAVRDVVERRGFWHAEVVQQRRGGEHIAVRSSSTLLRNDIGVPVGMVWVNRRHEAVPADPSGALPPAAGVDPRDITLGLERGEFVVHYQPVVRLDGTGWGGVEALVRWDHPELGLLSPAEFLPMADRSAHLVDLGHVVLAQACAQWSRWQQAGLDLHVTVNLSGSQLAEDDLPDRVEALMAAASMPPGALWLEVTESALVEDLHGGPDRLQGLAELGAFILLDDFGTGWASLAYLRDAPVHGLKIDRRFVAGLGSDAHDAAVVGSIVSLGLELRRAVIAEGVETIAQVQHLRRLGCELGQGFLFGRPQPAQDLERSAWLAGAAPAR